ncbi:hypothetical protein C8R44DRAFT_865234 [Mycena epipterygia]|nr:hypothetical protein C8R44DRAFT_865234 [Mycena epipterygia]
MPRDNDSAVQRKKQGPRFRFRFEPAAPSASVPQPAPPTPPTWRHPAELAYIKSGGTRWDDLAIVRFLRGNARRPRRASRALTACLCCGSPSSGGRRSRSYSARARVGGGETAGDAGAMNKDWRCALFDRPLRRYYNKWFIMRDEFVRDFWREFGEEEYKGDVLKLGWSTWVLVLWGYKGFQLTKEEAENGICAAEFMDGLVVDEEAGTFEWIQNSLQPVDT